ncbi:major capsid protein [Methylobacterium sp. MA0201]|uniref:major capsid protein n=1 Tax=Methylobacterium alsaeris TaxID=3344826 RepID=UPI0037568259
MSVQVGNILSKSAAFDTVAMTNAIVDMQFASTGLDEIFQWEVDTSLTDTVELDHESGLIYLLPSTPRNAEAPIAKRTPRGTSIIKIPGFAERDSVLNSSLLGVRETGSLTLKTLEGERNRRLQRMGMRLLHTNDHQRARALDGVLTDVDGTVLGNLYQLLGGQQRVVGWDLTNAKFDLQERLIELKRISEDFLGGVPITGYVLLTGRNAGARLRRNKDFKIASQDAAGFLLQVRDNRKGVRIMEDIDVVDYGRARLISGVAGSNGFIDDDSAYFVPVGPGFARTIYGPSDIEEYFGNPLPFYVSKEPLKNNKGIEMLVESYVLNYFARPQSVIKVTIQGDMS